MLDKSLTQPGFDITALLPGQGAELASAARSDEMGGGIEVPIDGSVEMDEDGGATINLGEDAPAKAQMPQGHFDNLVPALPVSEQAEAKNYVMEAYDLDKASRKDWEEAYTKGLNLLGLKIEERTEPFAGATGVYHPMLMEAIGQFQAGAYKELIPANGPVNTKIIGKPSPELEKKAGRVKDYMNYKLMFEMEEYEPDFDQMLFYVALAGSTFKKVYKDPDLQRTVSLFIQAENMLIPYTASSLRQAERITQVMPMSRNRLKKLQESGFYAESALPSTTMTVSEVKEKYDELEGRSPTYGGSKDDSTYTVLECHCNFSFPSLGDSEDVRSPYIITVIKETGDLLGVRRNWEENDARKRRIEFFVHYKFTPGLGFYGFGLIHLLGNLSTSATANLRQLIDAGTLANLPGGFKTRGLRVANDQVPIAPGEWRDVDVPGNNLRESLVPLPYKEPSATLFQLLGFVVQAGEKFVGTQELGIADGNKETPVGTTVALLERGTKVMSAVHKRLHGALKVELKLLATCFAMDVDAYPYDVDGAAPEVFKDDFSPKVDVQPVSDPNIFSMAQRVVLAQEQLKLATSMPDIHNIYEAYKRMYSALGVQNIDDVLTPPTQPMPENPAIENGRMPMLASGAPGVAQLKAFPSQDQDAHIAAHMAFAQSRVVKTAPAVYAVLLQHVYEHIAIKCEQMARQELKMPPMQDPTKEQPVDQVSMDPKLQALSAQKTAEFLVKFAEYEDQFLGPLEEGDDPLVALKAREISVLEEKNKAQAREAEAKRKQELTQTLLGFKAQAEDTDKKLAAQQKMHEEKIKSQEQVAGMKASVDMSKAFITAKKADQKPKTTN